MHLALKRNCWLLPVATPKAEFVHAPVTAALACFVLSCARMPERHIPFRYPLFNANSIPNRAADFVVRVSLFSEDSPPRFKNAGEGGCSVLNGVDLTLLSTALFCIPLFDNEAALTEDEPNAKGRQHIRSVRENSCIFASL